MYYAHPALQLNSMQMFTRPGAMPPLLGPVPLPPLAIVMTVTPEVIFTNESSTVSWNCTNSSCFEAGLVSNGRTLVPMRSTRQGRHKTARRMASAEPRRVCRP